MNRTVQVCLTVIALVSLINAVHAETMAERRQRIMRKYLRERQTITQSDFLVPDEDVEDARVVDSEQYKEPQVGFQREEGGMKPLPSPPRPAPRPVDQSWWLADTNTAGSLFADPWTSLSGDKDTSPYGNTPDRRRDPYSRDRSSPGMQGQDNSEQAHTGYYGSGQPAQRTGTIPGLYGRPQTDSGDTSTGWGLTSGRTSYGTTPSSGLLQTPYPSTYPSSSDDQTQTPGYVPYQSPYQTQRNQQGRTGTGQQPQQEEYVNPTPYQKWKDKNKTWDPTADDAYLDDLMRNKRR